MFGKSVMTSGSGLIHTFMGEAFPKLIVLHDNLPAILEAAETLGDYSTTAFNIEMPSFIYLVPDQVFVHIPFVIGKTSASDYTFTLNADIAPELWSIDENTGEINYTMPEAAVGVTTIVSVTVHDNNLNESRTGIIYVVGMHQPNYDIEEVIITVNGDEEVSIAEGTPYVDPGVTYSIVPDDTFVSGVVDHTTPGYYLLQYVAEKDGRQYRAFRIVTVIGEAVTLPIPEITLVGLNPVMLDIGDSYTDSGAIFTNADSTTTVGEASVDISVAGAYSITYTGVNTLGSVSKTRIIIVKEETVENTTGSTIAESTGDVVEFDGSAVLTVSYPAGYSYISNTNPLRGSVTHSGGDFTYTPNGLSLNVGTIDSFNYSISDGTTTLVGTIYIAIVASDLKAVNVLEDLIVTAYETPVTQDLVSNDPETTTIVSVSNPLNGSISNTSSSITYTPASGFSGTDYVDVTIQDTLLNVISVRTYLLVQAPIVAAEAYVNNDVLIVESSSSTATLFPLLNDSAGLHIGSIAEDPDYGSASLIGNTSISYTKDPYYRGLDTFTYNIEDSGNVVVGTSTVTVVCRRAMFASDDSISILQNASTTVIDVSTNDPTEVTDWSIDIDAVNGTVVNNFDGTFDYTPDAGFFGTDTFTYIISNDDGDEPIGVVRIYVLEVVDNTPVPFESITPDYVIVDVSAQNYNIIDY